MAGNRVPLNLGPRSLGPGLRVPLNLGVAWDVIVEPPIVPLRATWGGAAVRWQLPARRSRAAAPTWGAAPRVSALSGTRWAAAARVSRAPTLSWGDLALTSSAWRVAHSDAGRRGRSIGAAWRGLPQVSAQGAAAWGRAGARTRAASSRWAWLPAIAAAMRSPWLGELPRVATGTQMPWRSGRGFERIWDMPWLQASAVRWHVDPPATPPEPPPPSTRPPGNRVGLNLGCAPLPGSRRVPLNLGVTACYAVRPARRAYVIINTLSVVRLPDRTPIHAESIDIAAAAGAAGWDLSMALADPDHVQLLQPSSAGPVSVEVTINGYVWVFVVESRGRQRQWDPLQGLVRTISVSGRSRSALLSAPYAPARSRVNTADRQAQQLVDDELENTGFTAEYSALSWLVPAGAWYYDGATPLDAIARVAAASGAVVLTDPATDTLRIVARYPVSPWDWTSTAPAHVILDDLVLDDSMSQRSVPRFDAVIVAGELEGKGVLVRVSRDGEAGNLYAPQATDPLINTVQVAAERGRNILSDRGEQELVDLTLPMLPASVVGGPHRIQPLELVQVQEAAGDWVGLSTAVRVSARSQRDASGDVLVVEQTVSLERHYTDAN